QEQRGDTLAAVCARSRGGDGSYPNPDQLVALWRARVAAAGGTESVVGHSVAGRALWRFDLGRRDGDAPAVLLTALIHGNEVIGSIALLEVVTRLADSGALRNQRQRLVVLPMANPDGFAANMDRLDRGLPAWVRGNANGVDLNRNFPLVLQPGERPSRSPLAGSSWRVSPWFRGPHPLSEPESRVIADVARDVRPTLALAFHSFGQLLLHPWGYKRAPHPRASAYRALADTFLSGRVDSEFEVRQMASWYSIGGGLDDWLDTAFETFAFTVEVSRLDKRLFHPRVVNPFWWSNPVDKKAALDQVVPGVLALLESRTSSSP
ncbi:MAG: M14 family metallopeptidase, partial [Pseudomonadota bacterium]